MATEFKSKFDIGETVQVIGFEEVLFEIESINFSGKGVHYAPKGEVIVEGIPMFSFLEVMLERQLTRHVEPCA